jgi:hypothetical protein
MDWLWVAASMGSGKAAAEIGVFLVSKCAMERGKGKRAEAYRRRADEWFALRDARAAATVGPGLDSIAVAVDLEAKAAEVRGRVVVRAIGDPSSREGQDILRRYGSIVGRTLPYGGKMPAPGEMRREILARWPWAHLAADAVESALAVRRLSGDGYVRLPNLLLVGPSGSGKTSLGEWLARRLGLHGATIPCGGASDAAGLTATTRSWATSRPSAVANAMAEGGTCNPVLVLDEIDKTTATGSPNGSVADALLQIVNASSYTDGCLLAAVDVSAVSYVATANDLRRVSPHLRDRFDVVPVPAPQARHMDTVHANALADFCRITGVAPVDLPRVPHEAMGYLGETFRKGAGSARSYYLRLQQVLSREIALAEERRAFGRDAAPDPDEARRRAIAAFDAGTMAEGPMQ